MPNRCIVYGCSNISNIEKGIPLHKFPSEDDSRAQVRRRRQQWIAFVQRKRKHFTPSKSSRICSAHFDKEEFEQKFVNLSGQPKPVPSLKKYVFGVVTIPKFQTPQEPEPPSDRTQRTKRRNVHVHINLRSVIVLDMFVYTVFVK